MVDECVEVAVLVRGLLGEQDLAALGLELLAELGGKTLTVRSGVVHETTVLAPTFSVNDGVCARGALNRVDRAGAEHVVEALRVSAGFVAAGEIMTILASL